MILNNIEWHFEYSNSTFHKFEFEFHIFHSRQGNCRRRCARRWQRHPKICRRNWRICWAWDLHEARNSEIRSIKDISLRKVSDVRVPGPEIVGIDTLELFWVRSIWASDLTSERPWDRLIIKLIVDQLEEWFVPGAQPGTFSSDVTKSGGPMGGPVHGPCMFSSDA